MDHYSQRVRERILPLSVGNSLPEVFSEWSVTEHLIDHGTPCETCELCAQESLRYQFEIRNSLTSKTMWVGSQCILKFGVSVYDKGRRLTPDAARLKLTRLMEQMRLESCIKALEALAVAEKNAILSNALKYFRQHKYLSPKQAFVVLWRLQRNRIDHNPSFFKIDLRHAKFKSDLKDMEESRVHVLWPALSAGQREIARRLGHQPPAPPARGGASEPRER